MSPAPSLVVTVASRPGRGFAACTLPYIQDGKLPLHYAAAKGASLEVMRLLLDANRDAPGVKDNVRRCTHTPCMPLARCCQTYEYIEAVCALRTALHRTKSCPCTTPP